MQLKLFIVPVNNLDAAEGEMNAFPAVSALPSGAVWSCSVRWPASSRFVLLRRVEIRPGAQGESHGMAGLFILGLATLAGIAGGARIEMD